MKKPALPSFPQQYIPQNGQLIGGLLDGWSFAFQELRVVHGVVAILVRVTRPHWPFPASEPVLLNAGDFEGFRASHAVHYKTETLIRAALNPQNLTTAVRPILQEAAPCA